MATRRLNVAFYVKIEKLSESAAFVEYKYSADGLKFGRLHMDRSSGECSVVQALEGDEKAALYMRAAAKLRSEWRKGVVPDVTEWAS
jgi:hypothetical protein